MGGMNDNMFFRPFNFCSFNGDLPIIFPFNHGTVDPIYRAISGNHT